MSEAGVYWAPCGHTSYTPDDCPHCEIAALKAGMDRLSDMHNDLIARFYTQGQELERLKEGIKGAEDFYMVNEGVTGRMIITYPKAMTQAVEKVE